MSPVRTSPVAGALAAHTPAWAEHAGMPAAIRLAHRQEGPLRFCDTAALVRAGLKGPQAAEWLAARGVPVPAEPNTWLPLPEGGLVARLARTEFLVEDGWTPGAAARLLRELAPGSRGVYPVPRQDCALAIAGGALEELFAQTCNVPVMAQDPAARIVTLTQMVGVGVTLLRSDLGPLPCVRLWCDYTSGPYLWETLEGIVAELGGGPVGVEDLFGRIGAP